MKKTILGTLVLILIGAGALIIQKQVQDIGQRLDKAQGDQFIEILINAPEKQTAPLVPPGLKEDEASGTVGTAYRLLRKEKTYFAVLAIMPDLEEGQSYQVWIGEAAVGTLSQNQTGQWLVWRKEDNHLSSFNKVRILKDEDVVLEGNF